MQDPCFRTAHVKGIGYLITRIIHIMDIDYDDVWDGDLLRRSEYGGEHVYGDEGKNGGSTARTDTAGSTARQPIPERKFWTW